MNLDFDEAAGILYVFKICIPSEEKHMFFFDTFIYLKYYKDTLPYHFKPTFINYLMSCVF